MILRRRVPMRSRLGNVALNVSSHRMRTSTVRREQEDLRRRADSLVMSGQGKRLTWPS
jgi:hypothetical protein